MVKDRGSWRAAVHGVAEYRMPISDWKTTDCYYSQAFPEVKASFEEKQTNFNLGLKDVYK